MSALDPHISGGVPFKYPGAGDEAPGSGPLLLLTEGGTCVNGTWDWSGRYIGYAKFPPRDKEKEALLKASKP
jgi:hypothetical protein